jgi:long-subunit acyl-CoA synthetase (AMP-forming)
MERMAGRPSASLQYKLANKIVMSKVKQALGFNRCKYFITGAGEKFFNFF